MLRLCRSTVVQLMAEHVQWVNLGRTWEPSRQQLPKLPSKQVLPGHRPQSMDAQELPGTGTDGSRGCA